MQSNQIVSQALVASGAYKDLPQPIIFTSGELGITYINTDKLVGDNGVWEQFGNDAGGMIAHAISVTKENPKYDAVIDVLAEKVKLLDPNVQAISGGQRKDWLFSGPVAQKLGLMHISLYKQHASVEKIEISLPEMEGPVTIPYERDVNTVLLRRLNVIHIADLLTVGSSCYRIENGFAKGWFQMLRGQGAYAHTLITVVNRSEGGEKELAEQNIITLPIVTIDDDFIRRHSEYPEQVLEYRQNPRVWSERYLQRHGALAFIDDFNPEGKRVHYAKKFFERYTIRNND